MNSILLIINENYFENKHQYKHHSTGCKFRKRCKKVDSSWINRRKCVQQTCQYAPGATAPNVVNSPYGKSNR